MALLIAAAVGIVVGAMLGMLGAGGSILSIPALIYLLGQDPKAATTGSLIIVGITATSGLLPHLRAHNVAVRQGVIFAALSAPTAWLGSHLVTGINDELLLALLALLLVVVATVMLRKSFAAPRSTAPTAVPQAPTRSWMRYAPLVLVAAGIGLLTGFFGVGAGFAIVPGLVMFLGYSPGRAVGTSVLIIAINSLVTFSFRISHGADLDWPIIATFTALSVVGGLVGGRFATSVSGTLLTRLFALLLYGVAVAMGAQSVAALT